MRKLSNKEKYRERRRAAAAVLIALIATMLDAVSTKGSGWPIIQAFGFFLILASAPQILTRIIDITLESDNK